MPSRTRAWRREQRERTTTNRRREVHAIVGDVPGVPEWRAHTLLGCPDGRHCPFCGQHDDRARTKRDVQADIREQVQE